MSQRHVLHRVVFDLQLSDAAQAFSEQKRLVREFQEDVVAELEKSFDQLVSPHQHLRLQKVAIDVGSLQTSNWREKLVSEVQKAIQKQLAQDESPLKMQTQNVGQWLAYFLREGTFPWWAAGRSLSELVQALRTSVAENDDAKYSRIVALLTESPVAIERFFAQFPTDLVDDVLIAHEPGAFRYWKKVREALAFEYYAHIASTFKAFWLIVFGPTRHQAASANALMTVLPVALHRIQQALGNGKSDLAIFSEIVADVIVAKPTQVDLRTENQLPPIPANRDNGKQRAEEHRTDGLFINNAGLVIFAPFLNTLFDRTGLLSGITFVDDQARVRAILLMQYLVTGQTDSDENELPLNKLLAGLPLEAPVGRTLDLSTAEREEIDGLLQSVIDHWTEEWYRQKKTVAPSPLMSMDTLRETYLHRTGKLNVQAGGDWLLQVEHNTLDLLIPFWRTSAYTRTHTDGFRIHYPWMEKKLVIEWSVGAP